MANLTYRQSVQQAPASTTTKNAPLTLPEMDGNLKSLNDELALKAPSYSPIFTGIVATDSIVAIKNYVSLSGSIPSSYNALSIGPITVNEGVDITIGDNGSWSIL